MKKFVFIFIALMPLFSVGQVHLGATIDQIEAMYPNKAFKTESTIDSITFISTKMQYGTFLYYFDKETGLSNTCLQIPSSMKDLNTQVEIYNNEYVEISETSWRAYIEGGRILKILLSYEANIKQYVFSYSF